MNKERVVYYDCFVADDRYKVTPREAFSHGILEHISRDKTKEIVGIGIDKVDKHEINKFNPFSCFRIIQGMNGKIDTLIMPTFDIVGHYAAIISLYRVLKEKGIKLQFFVEGEVDEKFIEILHFIQEKEDAWREFVYNDYRKHDSHKSVYYFMEPKWEEISISNYINEMFSEQLSLFNILECK